MNSYFYPEEYLMKSARISPDRFIGRRFFYADEETGIGWESVIDDVHRCWDNDAVILELSCGTRVTVGYIEQMRNPGRAFSTNLKETND